ncbi:hypothetical protein BJV82DRAFT_674460 [Fennellomyces sp. T-0311]|nr:hypothetical protein BJV82DRAFT_674460 [Fennellomyces sp. T-0311]
MSSPISSSMTQMTNDNVRFNDPYTTATNVFCLDYGAAVEIPNPLMGATSADISKAFQALSVDKRQRLNERTDQLNDKSQQGLTGTDERREILDAYRRDLISRVYAMGDIFDCDISLMIASRNPDDGHAEGAIPNSDASQYAQRKMGDIDEFIKRCKEFRDANRNGDGGEQDPQENPAASNREDHKRKCEISDYFRNEYFQATGKKVQRLKWGGYRRMKYLDTYNNKRFGYRNNKHGVDLLGYDFGTAHAIAPGELNKAKATSLKALVDSSISAAPEQKVVKIVQIDEEAVKFVSWDPLELNQDNDVPDT